MVQGSRRKEFLARMLKEAMKPYEHLGEEWSEDEKEFLPVFMHLIGSNKLVLDLAGVMEGSPLTLWKITTVWYWRIYPFTLFNLQRKLLETVICIFCVWTFCIYPL